MYSMSTSWFVRDLAVFAVIGCLLGLLIWFWRRRKERNRIYFQTFLANLVCYLLWFATFATMFFLQKMPSICSVIDYRFPAYVFVISPMILALCSIPLSLLGLSAEEGERRYPVIGNGLIFLLWACMIVPPN